MNAADFLRFERNISPEPNTGCWLWAGHYIQKGYGRMGLQRTFKLAHRLSFEHFVRPIAAGEFILHRCDNPPCVNPAHLFAGSIKDNTADCWKKGRNAPMPIGSDAHFSKLTAAQVVAIRQEYARGLLTQKQIGAIYGVAKTSIRMIVLRRNWRHVP